MDQNSRPPQSISNKIKQDLLRLKTQCLAEYEIQKTSLENLVKGSQERIKCQIAAIFDKHGSLKVKELEFFKKKWKYLLYIRNVEK